MGQCDSCRLAFRQELEEAFQDMFPLASPGSLPFAPSHMKAFLKERIADEVEKGLSGSQARLVRILCEASPLKTHMEDMVRIVVEKAKTADKVKYDLEQRVIKLTNLNEALKGTNQHQHELVTELRRTIAELKEQLIEKASNATDQTPSS